MEAGFEVVSVSRRGLPPDGIAPSRALHSSTYHLNMAISVTETTQLDPQKGVYVESASGRRKKCSR